MITETTLLSGDSDYGWYYCTIDNIQKWIDDDMGPLISVIIPIHNTSRYLPRCMESIINSDCKNLEIICINDGSTDNCLEILQE